MTPALQAATGVWGKIEVRQGAPGVRSVTDATYVPYRHNGAWGIFGADGRAVADTVDLHGPDGTVDWQHLTWSGTAAVAPERTYVYGGYLNPHYGHFLVNSLARLWLLAGAGRPPHKILFHANGTSPAWFTLPFTKAIFEALDLTVDDLVILDAPARVPELIVPLPSFQEQHFIHSAYRDLCRQIGSRILAGFVPRGGLRPVYLSKTALPIGVGGVVNEKMVERRLEQAGVDIVYPETLPLREQIGLFVERPLILGTISSSFHTSIFVPPTADLLILSTTSHPNSNFQLIDAVNGNRATYLFSDATDVVTNRTKRFLTTYRFQNPRAVAEDLLARLGLPGGEPPRPVPGQAATLWPAAPSRLGVSPQTVTPRPQNAPKGSAGMSLYSLFLNNTGRPIHKAGHYFFAYERHFGRYVGQPLTFFEIGAGNGGSSQMWKRWFGPLARVVSIDINPVCLEFEDEQVAVRIGDQADPDFLESLIEEFGTPDIVLDDGSHQMPDVTASFDFLYERLAANGVYMIEDVHTAYWPDFGGGRGEPASIVERFKDLIDLLNAEHVRDGSLQPGPFTRSTVAMTAYDSVLVFERAPVINKFMHMIGDDSKRINY